MTALPRLEDGYVRIANELYDAVLLFPFTGREQKVVFTIFRKTYGYNKKEDDMSASQIGDMCGLARTHVTAVLNDLATRRIITKRPGQYGSIIGINKRYSEWLRSGKTEFPIYASPAPASASTSTDSVQVDSTDLVQGCTISVLASCLKKQQADSTDSVHPCTESVHVPDQYTPCTDSVQVDSTESVHTKDNLPKEKEKPPIPPKGGNSDSDDSEGLRRLEVSGKKSSTKGRAKRDGTCFDDWMTEVKATGGKPIPEDSPVFAFAKSIKLPVDFVRLCWVEFQRDHTGNTTKLQRSWLQTFGNYVRKGYYQLWFEKDGAWALTTRGKMLEAELKAKRGVGAGGDAEPVRRDPRFAGAK